MFRLVPLHLKRANAPLPGVPGPGTSGKSPAGKAKVPFKGGLALTKPADPNAPKLSPQPPQAPVAESPNMAPISNTGGFVPHPVGTGVRASGAPAAPAPYSVASFDPNMPDSSKPAVAGAMTGKPVTDWNGPMTTGADGVGRQNGELLGGIIPDGKGGFTQATGPIGSITKRENFDGKGANISISTPYGNGSSTGSGASYAPPEETPPVVAPPGGPTPSSILGGGGAPPVDPNRENVMRPQTDNASYNINVGNYVPTEGDKMVEGTGRYNGPAPYTPPGMDGAPAAPATPPGEVPPVAPPGGAPPSSMMAGAGVPDGNGAMLTADNLAQKYPEVLDPLAADYAAGGNPFISANPAASATDPFGGMNNAPTLGLYPG